MLVLEKRKSALNPRGIRRPTQYQRDPWEKDGRNHCVSIGHIPSITTAALSRDTSPRTWVEVFFLNPKSFFWDQGSCSFGRMCQSPHTHPDEENDEGGTQEEQSKSKKKLVSSGASICIEGFN